MSELGRAIREARRARHLSHQALAKALGYSERGANKGARRLRTLEETGMEKAALIRAVADVLALDPAYLTDLAHRDEAHRAEAWERWADEPICPRLIIRHGPHWFHHIAYDLPSEIATLDEAERHASDRMRTIPETPLARLHPPQGRLIFSRRLHVHIDHEGSVIARVPQNYRQKSPLPYGSVGGKPFILKAS